jgi:hypothetical protein
MNLIGNGVAMDRAMRADRAKYEQGERSLQNVVLGFGGHLVSILN